MCVAHKIFVNGWIAINIIFVFIIPVAWRICWVAFEAFPKRIQRNNYFSSGIKCSYQWNMVISKVNIQWKIEHKMFIHYTWHTTHSSQAVCNIDSKSTFQAIILWSNVLLLFSEKWMNHESIRCKCTCATFLYIMDYYRSSACGLYSAYEISSTLYLWKY